jgi:hypothetical protein
MEQPAGLRLRVVFFVPQLLTINFFLFTHHSLLLKVSVSLLSSSTTQHLNFFEMLNHSAERQPKSRNSLNDLAGA